MTPIFNLRDSNSNHSALVVPQEEGATEEDLGYSSIGDATQRFMTSLNQPDRQLWEATWLAPDGHVFRAEESNAYSDDDQFDLMGKDLSEEFEKYRGTMKGGDISALQEAFEQEKEKRAQSEDAMDRGELLSMSDLEENPGLARCVDLPRPAKDKVCYMGDTIQLFYDFFPEGAPFARQLNQAFSILTREWEDITEDFANWYKREITVAFPKYVHYSLNWLVDQLVEGKEDPQDLAEKILLYIDDRYAQEWHDKSRIKSNLDAVYSLLHKKDEEWEKKSKLGCTVYPEIKQFGSLLFKNFRAEMKPSHWAIYRSIKNKYHQKLIIRGVNINNCSLSKLIYLFGGRARDVWFARPFKSVEELRTKGYLTVDIFADDEKSKEILDEMALCFEKECIPAGNITALAALGRKLIIAQKENKYPGLSYSPLWSYYNLLKKEMTDSKRK
jgi:hypothetical protein